LEPTFDFNGSLFFSLPRSTRVVAHLTYFHVHNHSVVHHVSSWFQNGHLLHIISDGDRCSSTARRPWRRLVPTSRLPRTGMASLDAPPNMDPIAVDALPITNPKCQQQKERLLRDRQTFNWIHGASRLGSSRGLPFPAWPRTASVLNSGLHRRMLPARILHSGLRLSKVAGTSTSEIRHRPGRLSFPTPA
jgi:hypothetical protein